MKLSLIICLYNTDRVLFENCIKSIVCGTLRSNHSYESDYEICVVDDGSNVDYSDIVERYGLNYTKTENRGIFLARLRGIEMASGEYIAFVDSDDTVSFNYHRPMIEAAENNGADIVINDWAFHTERTRYYCKRDTTICTDIDWSDDEVLKGFMAQEGREHSYYVLWNKIFKAEILKYVLNEVSHIAIGEKRFNYSEDALMCFFAFNKAKRVVNVHTGYYFYRIHSTQTVNVTSKEKLLDHIRCMGTTFRIMRETILEGKREELLSYLENWVALMSRTHYSYAKNLNDADLYEVIKNMYGVSALKKSSFRDGAVYAKTALIAENITEIDKEINAIYTQEEPITVCIKGTSDYVKRSLESLLVMGCKIVLSDKGGLRLPKEIIRLKNRIVMNPLVYSVGMILFPKGSKIRSFLKKKI